MNLPVRDTGNHARQQGRSGPVGKNNENDVPGGSGFLQGQELTEAGELVVEGVVGRSIRICRGSRPKALRAGFHGVHGPNGRSHHGFVGGIPQADSALIEVGKLGEQSIPSQSKFTRDVIPGVHSVCGERMVDNRRRQGGLFERRYGVLEAIVPLLRQGVVAVGEKERVGAVNSLQFQLGRSGPQKVVFVFEWLRTGIIHWKSQQQGIGRVVAEQKGCGESSEDGLGGVRKDLAPIHAVLVIGVRQRWPCSVTVLSEG
mmetsp:Transcript_12754/g.36015  ORF Transcript_12754/g.36015 Transcript_12754/m.36015 type:complete len:258 (-) Transcript_12754:485-1258(-)